jgi:hypothetical protein
MPDAVPKIQDADFPSREKHICFQLQDFSVFLGLMVFVRWIRS